MKKAILGSILLMLPLLAGCNNNQPVQGEIKITDLIGREVMVNPGSYSRVVCIGAGALRMYSYVGDVDKLAGVEDIDNESLSERPKMFDGVARPYFIANKDKFALLPTCGVGGPQNQKVEKEKILSCRPDIVISEYEDVEQMNELQSLLEVPVITIDYGSKGIFDEKVQDSINLLGMIFSKEERATYLTNYINTTKEDISSRTSNLSEEETSKKVYICGLGQWGTTSHLYTAKNYEPFNVAHINNIADSLTNNGVQPITKEQFEAYGPNMDVMIFDAAAVKNIKPLYKEDSTMFDSCKAWKNGEVYLQMPYNAYYTNLELALVNTYYNAIAVYPNHFADIDIEIKTNEVTKTFLGKELNNEIKSYQHSFGGYQKINTETFFN